MGDTYREVPEWIIHEEKHWETRRAAGDDTLLQMFVHPRPDVSGSNWREAKMPDEDWRGYHIPTDRRRAETSGWRRRNKVRIEKGMEPEPYPRSGSHYQLQH